MRREYPRVPGPGRAILITLLVLVVVGVGADFGARAIAESRLASSVQASLDLPQRPDIELEGFPFLLQAARGRLDGVSVELRDVEAGGVPLESVTLSFEDLVFDGVELVGGTGTVASRGGTAQVVMTEDALSRFLQDQGTPVLVRFRGPTITVSTRINAGSQTTTATAEGPVRIESGRLVFSPDDVEIEGSVGVPAAALAFDVALPALVPGLTYETVLVHDGVATVEASLAGAELDVG
ncbi:MAG: LmeA family phospholipid-binding protein [Actinomycetota bacterium]